MARDRPDERTGHRRTLLAAALVGWVALIVVAAGRPVDNEFWIGLPDLSDLIAVLWLAALAVGTVLLLQSSRVAGPAPAQTRRGRWFMWVVMAGLLLLVATNPDLLDRFRLDEVDADAAEEPAAIEAEPEGPLPPPDLQIEAVHVYLLLAGLAGLWTIRRLTRSRVATDGSADDDADSEYSDAELAEQLATVLDEARWELSRTGEPRQRVLAAYAEIEQTLTDHGLPRRRHETSTDHATRVLADLPIDAAPLVDLGRLYRRARYSDHDVTEADQTRALADLEQVSLDLARHSTPLGDQPRR